MGRIGIRVLNPPLGLSPRTCSIGILLCKL